MILATLVIFWALIFVMIGRLQINLSSEIRERRLKDEAESLDFELLIQMRDAYNKKDMDAVERIKAMRIANKLSDASKAYISKEKRKI